MLDIVDGDAKQVNVTTNRREKDSINKRSTLRTDKCPQLSFPFFFFFFLFCFETKMFKY